MNNDLQQPLAFVHLSQLMHDTSKKDWTPAQFQHLFRYARTLQEFLPTLVNIARLDSEDYVMAGYKTSQFSSLRLGKEDEKKFETWVKEKSVNAQACLEELGGSGFKVSLSYVVNQNAWCVSVIGTEATKKHRDMVMTSWSDDLGEAIAMAAYKHFVICNGDEWPVEGSGNRWG